MAYLQRKLNYLDPNEITFDRYNPRGETKHQITSDANFKRLVTSDKEYGVLEPIIVRKDGTNGKQFILVDGERRLRAAQNVNLNEVPALVAKDEINGKLFELATQL